MLLANSGVDVIVVEKDAQEPPESPEAAWTDWMRPGVAQFHQSHGLLPRGLQLLEIHLPTVVDHLRRFGAHPFNLTDAPPSSILDWTPEPEDDVFDSLAARRPIYELAFALAAEETNNLEIRRGTSVTHLLTVPGTLPGVPHITGVTTDRGESIQADLVVDAGGRRSPMPALLEDTGALRPPEEDGDFRFIYYTRYYRKTRDDFPQPYVLSRFISGSISIGTFPADNGTWSVTLYGTNSDRALRSARDPAVFETVIRAHPDRAHFVDGEPLTPVKVMAGVADRERTIHVEGTPVATGWIPIADAWACTNPILGRGITMGLMHATALIPALIDYADRPSELADAWEATTREHVRPWYVETRNIDRTRSHEMEAVRTGQISSHGQLMSQDQIAWSVAVATNPDAFRAQMEVVSMLSTSDEVMHRRNLQQVVTETTRQLPTVPKPYIPDRAKLERILAS
jgi:2-polyprenyl-6-methoxyphenol hydroxylase-like FAD-dependent oxidoreductase